MNVLVVGQGGREHALARALRLSPSVKQVHALPGSDGMRADAIVHGDLDWRDTLAVDRLLRQHKIELTVVGPEVPLAHGLSDALRDKGHLVFGPSRDAAQLESSKVFSKRFLQEAGVATARAVEVASVNDVERAMAKFDAPFVLKADGLAAGKGVFICRDQAELRSAAQSIFVERTLGEAGSSALLEEFQPGYEISCLLLTNGEQWEPLVLAADHKRLNDGEEGPNTGGMGTVAPFTIEPQLRERIEKEVFTPVLSHMKAKGLLYRGVLYVGLMVTEQGPNVLEFNVRFGDPEAQVILPLLDGDWGQVLREVATGNVPRLRWKNQAAACIVMAAEGYPDNPVKDTWIETSRPNILNGTEEKEALKAEMKYFLHAGTRREKTVWVTSGGRVLNSIGLGRTVAEAVERAYAQAGCVGWLGMQMRRDIGQRVLTKSGET